MGESPRSPLVRILNQQTPHGQWLPSLKERGISVHLAERMMRLRRKYPEILQIAEFDSVQAALNVKKTNLRPGWVASREAGGRRGPVAC